MNIHVIILFKIVLVVSEKNICLINLTATFPPGGRVLFLQFNRTRRNLVRGSFKEHSCAFFYKMRPVVSGEDI